MSEKGKPKGNLKFFMIILVIIGGVMLLGVSTIGIYFSEDDKSITYEGGIPYDETETGKILTNPSILINNGAETTDNLMVTLIINCGNASEMRIKTGAVVPWDNWESYKMMKIIKLGQPNPYFPIYTVSIQFRNGSYTSIVVYDYITYTGENPDEEIRVLQGNSPEISQELTSDNLIPINFSIMIGDHGIYGNYPDWSYYVDNYDWCTGSGNEEDPYIIEGIHVTNKNQTAHISIDTAEHFIIRNVTVSNYAKPAGHYIYAGIYIGKGEYGLIDNCTLINCSHGISLYEAKDALKITNNKFIGSHNDSDTGLGKAIWIHEAKNVNISYNDIYNYYDGIAVHDAEEIYIENNRVEITFGYIVSTGIYFDNVNDSTIIDNDLHGCEFSGHNYEDPIISSGGYPINLVDCYNIEVYGNRFYDLDGNLIVPDEPDDPDPTGDSTSMTWILVLGIILVISGVIGIVYSYLRRTLKNRE